MQNIVINIITSYTIQLHCLTCAECKYEMKNSHQESCTNCWALAAPSCGEEIIWIRNCLCQNTISAYTNMEYKVFFTVSTHVVKKGDAVVGERRENAQVEAAFEVWLITAFTQAKEEEVEQNQSLSLIHI